MSAAFKVQKLTAVNSLSKTKNANKSQQNTNNSILGEVVFSLTSISVLTYSPHALIQILTSLFENDSGIPPYAQVQKALQILSQPITDDILKTDLNSLILKNIHKKTDIYVLFCLWGQYLSIQSILQIITDKKLQQKILYTILVTYLSDCTKNVIWYEGLSLGDQINDLLRLELIEKNTRILEEIDAQITNLRIENHYHFLNVLMKLIKMVKNSQNLPIYSQLKKLPLNFLRNKTNHTFIDQMNQASLANIQSKRVSIKEFSKIIQYVNQNDAKQAKEIFEKSLLNKIQNKFNSEENQTFFEFVQSIFLLKNVNSIQKFLRSSLKNLFRTVQKQKLWKFINFNFPLLSFLPTESSQKRVFMIKFMSELSKQNEKTQKQIQKMLYSKYIFHFLEGRPFNFPEQIKFLETKSDMKFQHQRELISKCIKHIKNEKFLNIMTFNKSSFPESLAWPSDLSLIEMTKKYESNNLLKKVINKVKQLWEKVQQEVLKENKKIQLVFSVLRIQIDKKPIRATFQQFDQILRSYQEGKSLDIQKLDSYHYRTEYSPITSNQEQKMAKSVVLQKDQELHPIIIEAKIIKLMKKQLKKATVEQISKALSLNPEKIHQTIKKLVTKGYLQQHQDETYSYEA